MSIGSQAKLQGVVDESECQLLFEDRELDKDARIRFANLPSNAKLVLKTGKETVLGHRMHDDAPASNAREDFDGVQAKQTEGNTEQGSSSHLSEEASDRQQQQGEMKASLSDDIDQVYIFSETEMTKTAKQLSDDIDYDINENDILMLHASLTKKTSPSILKTQKMRDDEMQRKLHNLRPAPIRIEFPSGTCIQISVPGNSKVGSIYQRLQSILKPEVFADLYLYTVPPKTNLSQMDQSILAAGLLPAARLKVGFESPKDFESPLDIIKPEFSSRLGTEPPQREADQDYRSRKEDNPKNICSKGSASRVQKDKGPSSKVPKWLKLGST